MERRASGKRDEDFFVKLSDPVHATINQFHAKATVTILANHS